MRVAILSSEALPFAKTGGLADVTGSLTKALHAQDVNSLLVLPLYDQVDKALITGTYVEDLEVPWRGGKPRIPVRMSDALGAVNYDGHKRNKFLDMQLGPERGNYAEDTARLIDAEVKRIMTEAHTRATTILTDKRDMLETVTRKLLEQEVMEGATLRSILGVPPDAVTHGSEGIPLPPELR